MEISVEKAISLLENNMLANVMEMDNLKWVNKNKVKCHLFEGALVVITFDKKPYVRIIPTDVSCDYVKLKEHIKQYSNACLCVNIREENEKTVRDVFEKSYDSVKIIVDYGADEIENSDKNNNVRILTENDREAFVSMENEPQQYRPPLNVLFSVFVEKGNGEILAYFYENKMLGYISFNKLFDNVYDVDYIYVAPSQRGKGIGRALASSYVSTVKKRKGIAYWSNAKNEYSEKTAMSAGLNIVRKALIFN